MLRFRFVRRFRVQFALLAAVASVGASAANGASPSVTRERYPEFFRWAERHYDRLFHVAPEIAEKLPLIAFESDELAELLAGTDRKFKLFSKTRYSKSELEKLEKFLNEELDGPVMKLLQDPDFPIDRRLALVDQHLIPSTAEPGAYLNRLTGAKVPPETIEEIRARVLIALDDPAFNPRKLTGTQSSLVQSKTVTISRQSWIPDDRILERWIEIAASKNDPDRFFFRMLKRYFTESVSDWGRLSFKARIAFEKMLDAGVPGIVPDDFSSFLTAVKTSEPSAYDRIYPEIYAQLSTIQKYQELGRRSGMTEEFFSMLSQPFENAGLFEKTYKTEKEFLREVRAKLVELVTSADGAELASPGVWYRHLKEIGALENPSVKERVLNTLKPRVKILLQKIPESDGIGVELFSELSRTDAAFGLLYRDGYWSAHAPLALLTGKSRKPSMNDWLAEFQSGSTWEGLTAAFRSREVPLKPSVAESIARKLRPMVEMHLQRSHQGLSNEFYESQFPKIEAFYAELEKVTPSLSPVHDEVLIIRKILAETKKGKELKGPELEAWIDGQIERDADLRAALRRLKNRAKGNRDSLVNQWIVQHSQHPSVNGPGRSGASSASDCVMDLVTHSISPQ